MPSGSTYLTQNLQQRQQQTLTPLQVQYVRALEMTGPEVEEELRRNLDENPALTTVDGTAPDGGALEREEQGDAARESAEQLQSSDYRDPDEMPAYIRRTYDADALSPLERLARADGESLQDHLMAQLREQGLSPRQETLALLITGNIDGNGYLTRTVAELVSDAALQEGVLTDKTELTGLRDRIRALDPAGVGAADLRDCLLLQLRRLAPSDDVARATEAVTHYFDLLSRMQFDKLRSAMHLRPGDAERIMATVRRLNPKPGAAYGDSRRDAAMQVVPDFAVDIDHGTGRVTLTMANTLPELAVEESFDIDDKALKTHKSYGRDAQLFVRSRRDEARTFIKVLEMRRDTLMRVVRAIVAMQTDFLLSGDPSALKPMVLRDISERTGDDLSVVSRATAGKYISTPYGTYPLKYFFNERPDADSDASSIEVLHALKDIIEAEDKTRPLSDEALTRKLAEAGYNLARRTVTKYRERASIPPGRLRRQA